MESISNVIEVMISQLLPNEAIPFNDKAPLMRCKCKTWWSTHIKHHAFIMLSFRRYIKTTTERLNSEKANSCILGQLVFCLGNLLIFNSVFHAVFLYQLCGQPACERFCAVHTKAQWNSMGYLIYTFSKSISILMPKTSTFFHFQRGQDKQVL